MNGVVKEPLSHIRDYQYESVCGGITNKNFPSKWQIPDENTGTQKDQGQVLACVAETIASISEELWKRQTGEQNEISEGFIYGKLRDKSSYGWGMIVSKAMKYWQKIGTVPKSKMGILKEMPEMKGLIEAVPELTELASQFKISGYVNFSNYINESQRDMAIKNALTTYKYGLVSVSDTFFEGGSHCIQLVGWNDETNCYIIKNSWGKDWGTNGYGEVPKNKINQVYLPLLEDIKLKFKDVNENEWYYDDVKNMFMAGMIKGTSEDTFEPDKPLTRAEFCALGNRILKKIDENNDILNKTLNELLKQKNN